MDTYIPKYFDLRELVDRRTWQEREDSCITLFEPDALRMLDGIREFFDAPVTCNNWHKGGEYQFRGFRPSWCKVGAPASMHRFGKGFDLDVAGRTAEECRRMIVFHKDDPRLELINRMEDEVSWLHVDRKPVPERIRVFKP